MDAYQEALAPVINYLFDARDFSVIEFNLRTKPPTTARIYVQWDGDRDRRILAILAAMYFVDRTTLAKVAGVAEHNGKINWWCSSPAHAEATTRLFAEAARTTLYSSAWYVLPPQMVPVCDDGLINWQALPDDHPLRSPAKGFQIGVMKKAGASANGDLR